MKVNRYMPKGKIHKNGIGAISWDKLFETLSNSDEEHAAIAVSQHTQPMVSRCLLVGSSVCVRKRQRTETMIPKMTNKI
jgi:hypothetical protein